MPYVQGNVTDQGNPNQGMQWYDVANIAGSGVDAIGRILQAFNRHSRVAPALESAGVLGQLAGQIGSIPYQKQLQQQQLQMQKDLQQAQIGNINSEIATRQQTADWHKQNAALAAEQKKQLELGQMAKRSVEQGNIGQIYDDSNIGFDKQGNWSNNLSGNPVAPFVPAETTRTQQMPPGQAGPPAQMRGAGLQANYYPGTEQEKTDATVAKDQATATYEQQRVALAKQAQQMMEEQRQAVRNAKNLQEQQNAYKLAIGQYAAFGGKDIQAATNYFMGKGPLPSDIATVAAGAQAGEQAKEKKGQPKTPDTLVQSGHVTTLIKNIEAIMKERYPDVYDKQTGPYAAQERITQAVNEYNAALDVAEKANPALVSQLEVYRKKPPDPNANQPQDDQGWYDWFFGGKKPNTPTPPPVISTAKPQATPGPAAPGANGSQIAQLTRKLQQRGAPAPPTVPGALSQNPQSRNAIQAIIKADQDYQAKLRRQGQYGGQKKTAPPQDPQLADLLQQMQQVGQKQGLDDRQMTDIHNHVYNVILSQLSMMNKNARGYGLATKTPDQLKKIAYMESVKQILTAAQQGKDLRRLGTIDVQNLLETPG